MPQRLSDAERICLLQQAAPAKENLMISFDLHIHIYRPLRQVFSFIATPENDFQWQYGTLASKQISKGDLGIGTLFRTISHLIGQRIESVYEVTEFEPNRRYAFKAQSGPMDSHTLYTFEVTEGRTRVNICTQLSTGDLFKTGGLTVEKKVKKQYRENLALLKGILEGNPADLP